MVEYFSLMCHAVRFSLVSFGSASSMLLFMITEDILYWDQFLLYHFFLCSSIDTPPGPRETTIKRPPITDRVWKIK